MWNNKDGLLVRFDREVGVRGTRAGVTSTAGKEKELVFEVDLKDLPFGTTAFTADLNNDGTNDGFSGLDDFIPSGALIKGFEIVETETPATTTGTFTIGTYQVDGTAVTANGIRTIAGADGAQVGTVASQNLYVSVATQTADYTAGVLKIIVRFVTV